MPVIGHDAKAKKFKLMPSNGVGQNTFKGFVVCFLKETSCPVDCRD